MRPRGWTKDMKEEFENAPRTRTIEVDGIQLTEAQVRKAWAELQIPVIKHLQRVRSKPFGASEGVVLVGGRVQEHYVENFNRNSSHKLEGKFTVVNAQGSGSTYDSAEQLLHGWSIIPEGR